MKHSMELVSTKEARDHMATILNHVAYGGKKFTLTRHGEGIAVILSLDEWNAIDSLLQKLEDEEDIRDADAAIQRIRKGEKTISHKALKKNLGI